MRTDSAGRRELGARRAGRVNHAPWIADKEPMSGRRQPLADRVLHAYCLGCLIGFVPCLTGHIRTRPSKGQLGFALEISSDFSVTDRHGSALRATRPAAPATSIHIWHAAGSYYCSLPIKPPQG